MLEKLASSNDSIPMLDKVEQQCKDTRLDVLDHAVHYELSLTGSKFAASEVQTLGSIKGMCTAPSVCSGRVLCTPTSRKRMHHGK